MIANELEQDNFPYLFVGICITSILVGAIFGIEDAWTFLGTSVIVAGLAHL